MIAVPRYRVARPCPRAALTLALIAGVVGPLTAQTTVPPQTTDPRATLWLLAVAAHKTATIDESVRTVADWSRTTAITAVKLALRDAPDTAVLIKGLSLHTDAAIAERTHVVAGSATGSRSTVLQDGQQIGNSARPLQWEVGRILADALAVRPAGQGPDGVGRDGVEHARAWYHASSALLQQWVDYGTLRRHLDDGLRVFPTDATLLLYRATMHQAFADPRIQGWLREDVMAQHRVDANGFATGRAAVMQIGTPVQELALAERDLRRALALEPGLVEASIRLAHVLSAKGEPQEAATLARRARERPLPPFLAYYASMVLGRIEQTLGRPAEARAAFADAARCFPAAQSPRLALGVLALADGQSADGVRHLVATSGPAAPRDAADPWWSYFRQHEPDAKALLAAFRERAR